MRGLRDFERCGFRYAADSNISAGVTRALGDGFGHGLEMAVAGVIEHENFGH